MTTPERDAEGSAVCNMLGAVLLQDAEPSQQFIDEHPAVKVLMRLKREAVALRARAETLERRLAAAELQHAMSEGVLFMTVARLGGLVEGRPTERLNFLQRIDELRDIEREVRRLREFIARDRSFVRAIDIPRREITFNLNDVAGNVVPPVWACFCGQGADTAVAMAAHLKDAHGKD